MDTIVAGIVKLEVEIKSADIGKDIQVIYAGKTYSKTTVGTITTFILPPFPSPERAVSVPIKLVSNGSVRYTRNVNLGFGDNKHIQLWSEAEPATKGEIGQVESDLTALETRLMGRISYGTTDKADGSSYLKEGYIYCYIGS